MAKMAVKTYIGPHDEIELVIAGISYGLLKSGESRVIDDEIAESVAWPESLWQDGPLKKEKKVSD